MPERARKLSAPTGRPVVGYGPTMRHARAHHPQRGGVTTTSSEAHNPQTLGPGAAKRARWCPECGARMWGSLRRATCSQACGYSRSKRSFMGQGEREA